MDGLEQELILINSDGLLILMSHVLLKRKTTKMMMVKMIVLYRGLKRAGAEYHYLISLPRGAEGEVRESH